MPRKPQSEQDLQIEALFKQIKEIKAKDASASDVKRATASFRKAKTQLEGVMSSINEALSILEGGGSKEVDPEAPYGRKKDGTPRLPGGKGSPAYKNKQDNTTETKEVAKGIEKAANPAPVNPAQPTQKEVAKGIEETTQKKPLIGSLGNGVNPANVIVKK